MDRGELARYLLPMTMLALIFSGFASNCLDTAIQCVYCLDMQKISLTIRVDAHDLAAWQEQAGGNLSRWIRERLNEANGQGLRGAASVRVARRGIVAPERPLAEAIHVISATSTEVCSHGAVAYRCKTWGCRFYEVANGRGKS